MVGNYNATILCNGSANYFTTKLVLIAKIDFIIAQLLDVMPYQIAQVR